MKRDPLEPVLPPFRSIRHFAKLILGELGKSEGKHFVFAAIDVSRGTYTIIHDLKDEAEVAFSLKVIGNDLEETKNVTQHGHSDQQPGQ